jgi:hypothetical protein
MGLSISFLLIILGIEGGRRMHSRDYANTHANANDYANAHAHANDYANARAQANDYASAHANDYSNGYRKNSYFIT